MKKATSFPKLKSLIFIFIFIHSTKSVLFVVILFSVLLRVFQTHIRIKRISLILSNETTFFVLLFSSEAHRRVTKYKMLGKTEQLNIVYEKKKILTFIVTNCNIIFEKICSPRFWLFLHFIFFFTPLNKNFHIKDGY